MTKHPSAVANQSIEVREITFEPLYLSNRATLFQPPHPTPHMEIWVLAVHQPDPLGTDSWASHNRVERYRAWLRKVVGEASRSYNPAPMDSECQIS